MQGVFWWFSEIEDLSHKKTSPRLFTIFQNSFRILEAGSRRLIILEAEFWIFDFLDFWQNWEKKIQKKFKKNRKGKQTLNGLITYYYNNRTVVEILQLNFHIDYRKKNWKKNCNFFQKKSMSTSIHNPHWPQWPSPKRDTIITIEQ